MADTSSSKSGFWSTLPGILTGTAALIAAITGIIVAMRHPINQPQITPEQRPVASQPASMNPPAPDPVSSGPTFAGTMGPLENGISYNQGDLYDQPSSSAEQCSNICYNDNRCVAVTFIKSQQRCWVKNKIGTPMQSSDMISARRLAQ
ncbi:MAG: PAN domain-containing protein [Pseudomonadota bacterium]